ncbi:MAG: phosphatidylserine decarboxylase [Lentisphaeria bacterium]|nr:phosphatidylserine decarboxylase [Lentisphaeria bacterium]
MRLAKYGKTQWLSATVLLVFMVIFSGVLLYVSLPVGCFILVISLLAWGAFIAFFRDPHRVVGQDKTELVAPADGIVKDIELIPNTSCENEVLRKLFDGYDILRIGIVQSVFDVHINRVPCQMAIHTKVCREKGDGSESASLLLGGYGEIEGIRFPLALQQLSASGLRRIICGADEGEEIKKGRKYGMIQSGCRVELYLPAKSPVSITINPGERVTAGKTVLAVFSREKQD